MPQSDTPLLVHFHIPKTAGTSLTRSLVRAFGDDRAFLTGRNGRTHRADTEYFAGLPPERQERYSLVAGHVEMFLLDSLQVDRFAFCFLRDPVERMVSMYYFVKNSPNHHLHRTLNENKLTLRAFLEAGLWHELDNGMCRRLSGVMGYVPYGGCTVEVLRLAVNNLFTEFNFFGFQERFDHSLYLLSELLGRRSLFLCGKSNKGTRKAVREIDPQDREAVERFNRLDMELYRMARSEFEEHFNPLLERKRQEFDKLVLVRDRMKELDQHVF